MSDSGIRHVDRRTGERVFAPLRARLAVAIALTIALTAMGASWLTIRLARQSTSVEIATSEVVATIAFAIGAAALLTFLVDLLAQRLIYKPIEQELKDRNVELIDSYQRVFGLREQLANAEQLAAVGQTAANVAHQVGTPLNLISGYVQVLKEELGAASPFASRLAIIEEQVAKVTSTVRTLLDRSRHMGRKTRSTAGEIVAHVCEAMRPSFDAAGINLELHTDAADTPILVDATNFELALLNLMTNAVDAMPLGGTMTIRLINSSPGRVTIEISDTGHGIPKDLLPRIFEPWVSTKQPGRGTGLGLAIARDVVSAHGGSISVASEVRRGTTFMIDLPSDAGRDLVSSIS